MIAFPIAEVAAIGGPLGIPLIVDDTAEDFADRQPALNTPDPSDHGAVRPQAAKPIGPIAYILKARTTLLRDLGDDLLADWDQALKASAA